MAITAPPSPFDGILGEGIGFCLKRPERPVLTLNLSAHDNSEALKRRLFGGHVWTVMGHDVLNGRLDDLQKAFNFALFQSLASAIPQHRILLVDVML